MKDLLVILGAAASSSSSLNPPNRRRRLHHSTPFPQSKPSPTPAKKTARLPNPNPKPPPPPPSLRWDPVSATFFDSSPIKYYADLASKLAAAGRFRHFLRVAESAVASGIEPLGFLALLTPELVSAGVARLLSQEGMVWRAVEVLRGLDGLGFGALKLFDGVRRETVTKEVARECRRILEHGDVEEAVELMETLSGFHFPIRELVESSEIVGLCVRKRDPDLAIRFACIHPHTHIVFCTIIHEFGKKGDMMSALTAFEASKQKLSGPNMYAYRTVIDVCGLCGDHLKSRSVYEELLAEKVTPNVYVFNSLMNVNAHDLNYVMHVYEDMRILGVTGDITSYNILLKSCCLAARVDLAQDIYCEVQNLESTGVLKLDVFTYSTIIKIFADAKLWRMALKIKGDLLSAGFTPNVVIWSSLISACANAGLVEQAIQLFTDMLLAGCVPNSQCCNALLYACVEGHQYDRAFRLFQSWKESGFDVNVCSNAGVEHARGNSSRTMSNSMSKSHNLNNSRKAPFTPTTATYNILMKACGTNYLRAKALIDEMHAVGLSPNYISWTTLINVCGGSGSVDGAMQILSSMREAAGQPDVIAYTSAIKVCVERKFLDTAFNLFEEMKSHQIRPNLVTYKTLLRARSRYGSLQEVQQCLEIYQDMRKAGYKPNDYYLKQLIEEWCEGVIQNDNQIESKFTSLKKGDIGGPYSFLLEKVATHLERRNTESVVIDLQGLTKVEARIVVLAVLRMIKENYAQGCPLKDDLFIIIGVQKADMMNVTDEYEVEDAIIKLLRNEFGLEVILGGPKKVYLGASANEQGIVGSKRLPIEPQFPRRPAVLRRLKVTRVSLLFWLQKWESAN